MTKQSSPRTTKSKVQALAPEGLAPADNSAAAVREKNLFIKVDTFDQNDKSVGTRIVDMYHFGTRNWLQNHTWWAMHNGHSVVTDLATPDEVTEHTAAQLNALAAKFNTDKAA